jgi:two-component system, OmpR family, phosphate regulon sensor histidine kinase PhoR
VSVAIFISVICGLAIAAMAGYFWHEAKISKQLQQILEIVETADRHEDVSLPILSQLRRTATISRQRQQYLQQQLFSWQSLVEEAPIGYLQVDAEDRVTWCNHTARQLLQISQWHPSKARLLLELVRSYELDRTIAKTRKLQSSQELVWQFHFGYQTQANSQSIWLKAGSVVLADGAIGVFIESHQDRVDAAAAQERWLGDLAHEIRTPLTSIFLLAETLQTRVTQDLTKWADRILTETSRSIDLVQHFSELSRLETSATDLLRPIDVDLVKLIKDVWHNLEPISQQRQVEFIYTGPTQLIMKLDIARFTQVAINLFDNSLKYCPDRGRIWVDICEVEPALATDPAQPDRLNRVTIDLYDDGSGFESTDLPHVFDRLYRGDVARQRPILHPTLTSAPTGSGLGLAIVRQIVLAHQGTIVAKNHPTTGGAWLQITLPKQKSKS